MIFSKATIYKLGYPVMKLYWFFRRPTTEGVKCLVTYQDKILLIRHTYGSNLLTTVGGGIEKDEGLEEAVIREIHEEVGLVLTNLRPVGSVFHESEFKKDTIHVFIAEAVDETIKIQPAEILEANWHKIEKIPSDTSPLFAEFYSLARLKFPEIF